MKQYIPTFIITIVIASSINLFAVSVRNYSIAPLNRVSIYFDQMPTMTEGLLTQDKLTLNINLGEVDFTSEQQSIVGEGIIKKVELIKNDKNTILSMSLSEQRGFTIAKLPYSIGLVIEIFDWTKLDTTEEAYRMGLLSLIDNEVELAASDLLKGANGDIADAAFFLGSLYLNKGKINTALKLFRFADLKGTTINDNYAALNQIYTHKGQNTESEKYTQKYKSNTGNAIVPTIQLAPIIENENNSDLLPHIDSALNMEQDSINIMPDTAKIDTNKVEIKDTTKKEESIWEAEGYLLLKYVIGIAIALILLIVYLYLKWRNKQLRAIEEQKLKQTSSKKNTDNSDFNKIMTEKIDEQKKVQSVSKSTNQQQKKQIKKTEQISNSNTTNKNPNYKKKADDLIDLIDKMKSEDVVTSDSILEAELDNMKSGISTYNINKNKINIPIADKKNTANIDLASRLLTEQKRIQQEKLSNLYKTETFTSDKIDEVAQNLGMDKGSLETKQTLDNLLQNEAEFKKLSEKFGKKK